MLRQPRAYSAGINTCMATFITPPPDDGDRDISHHQHLSKIYAETSQVFLCIMTGLTACRTLANMPIVTLKENTAFCTNRCSKNLTVKSVYYYKYTISAECGILQHPTFSQCHILIDILASEDRD
jgi:hypothetical protein